MDIVVITRMYDIISLCDYLCIYIYMIVWWYDMYMYIYMRLWVSISISIALLVYLCLFSKKSMFPLFYVAFRFPSFGGFYFYIKDLSMAVTTVCPTCGIYGAPSNICLYELHLIQLETGTRQFVTPHKVHTSET